MCRLRTPKVIFRPVLEPQTILPAMRSISRCALSSSCLTLLVSPESAGGGFGRARVVSRRDVPFSFCIQNHYSEA